CAASGGTGGYKVVFGSGTRLLVSPDIQ
nr:myelin basic protein-specific T cell receptor V alpha chain {clone 2F9} [mice, SJL, mesenteric lymph nodes, regulatory T cells, Peptide Partial, 27 aa] [Mus sp.]AAB31620.1 myelin basic protein-specific T cell receptor V alpha chain {clone MM4} [mice, SJL, mesenteric lymph nodes, encephalitogenic T cells, Peptide Partial, 27 aa] [Mus sp.]